ncbi:MAG: hypothetical protein V1904_13440, partial [Bacteroidota bacterium]
MNKKYFSLTFALMMLFGSIKLFSQTPGMIYEPATGGGAAVLDPNGDGYTSATTAGFVTNDETESEIPYIPLVFPQPEPDSDLGPGPDCGFTDFVQQAVGVEDAAQNYIDGATNNWLFRLRMGSSAPNAKSYSILIDTDGKFGATGPNADPTYTTSNPGFELEIVLATKFGVYIYDVDPLVCPPTLIKAYPGTTNYQKSIALSQECTNPDYFYDFFVDFDDITAYDASITPSTGLRMVIVDNMAAQKSTLCQTSSASDLGGVGDCPNIETCFEEIIDNYPPCPTGTTCLDRSTCPAITSADAASNTVSGTSVHADGTVITVYINGTAYGTTTTVTGGVWSLSGFIPALVAGTDVVGASATETGMSESVYNCDLTTVTATAACVYSAAPTGVWMCSATKGIAGLAATGAQINVYYGSNLVPQAPGGGSTWAANIVNASVLGPVCPPSFSPTENFLWRCNAVGNVCSCTAGGGPCLPTGALRVTATEAGKCESSSVWLCNGAAATADPTITTNPILATTNTITGSVPAPDNVAGVRVFLYSNGIELGNTLTIAAGAWSIGSLDLTARECETISVVTVRTAPAVLCPSVGPVTRVITRTAIAPIVNGPICSAAAVTTVSGTSIEAAGTSIQVYENAVAEGTPTTVQADGTWTATFALNGISIALGNTITARASSACLTLSAVSNSVVVGTQTINIPTITTATIYE